MSKDLVIEQQEINQLNNDLAFKSSEDIKNKYTLQSESESNIRFNKRVQESLFTNNFRMLLENVLSVTNTSRIEYPSDIFDGVLDTNNIDGLGSDIHTFFDDAMQNSLLDGVCFIAVLYFDSKMILRKFNYHELIDYNFDKLDGSLKDITFKEIHKKDVKYKFSRNKVDILSNKTNTGKFSQNILNIVCFNSVSLKPFSLKCNSILTPYAESNISIYNLESKLTYAHSLKDYINDAKLNFQNCGCFNFANIKNPTTKIQANELASKNSAIFSRLRQAKLNCIRNVCNVINSNFLIANRIDINSININLEIVNNSIEDFNTKIDLISKIEGLENSAQFANELKELTKDLINKVKFV